ncbi:MAG: histidine kinase [Saprospiraceae bacterium]|nr:histidine kinase [Saprospiraceae bacterium]
MWKAILDAPAQVPSFIHYGVDEGLPSNLVYSIGQDKGGFLWFGTDKGLARFDGNRFHVFGINDGLPDSEILNVESDSKGRLWISPFKQNPCYWENGKFHTAQTDTFLQQTYLKSSYFDFQEDPNGRIWFFGGDRDAYCLEENQIRKIHFNYQPHLYFESDSREFIITMRGILELKTHSKSELLFSFFDLLDSTKIHDVSGAAVFYNQLFIAVGNTLILLSFENGRFIVQDKMVGFVGRVFTTSSGQFVLVTNNQGVLFFDCSSRKIVLKNTILKGKKINMMFEGSENILWFCTPDEGVYGLPQNCPVNYVDNFHPGSHNITSLALGNKGEIIAGNDEGGLYILKNNQTKLINLGSIDGSNRVLKTIVAENGTMYIATDELLFKVEKNMVSHFDFIGTPKSITYANHKLWFATSKQIGYYPESQKRFVEQFYNRRFTSMDADHERQIWAGGLDGIFSSRDSFVHNWGEEFPLLKTRIISIAGDKKGHVWVSTPNHGLLCMDVSGGKVTEVRRFNDQLKTPIHNIKTIYLDKQENMWLGTNKGVYVVKKDLSISHFDNNDGLIDNDINAILVQDDTLWIGTTKGLTKFFWGTKKNNASFPTYLAGIDYRLQNQTVELPSFKDVDYAHAIELPSSAGLIQIHLSGLDYASRGNINFEYVQKECLPPIKWLTFSNIFSLITPGAKTDHLLITENTLNLGARLRPGRYEFQFTAINARGERSANPAILYIFQRPYWYETVWCWLAIWLLLFWGLYKIINNWMAYRDLNASVSKLRLQALQAQMNPHFIGNSIYAIQQFFYPPNPEKASEYIELFNRLFRRTMHMAEQHFVAFSEDMEYYNDYLQMIQLRLGERFSFKITGIEKIPPSLPFPAMILQPIIENATIHGLSRETQSQLHIAFELQGNKIQTVIEDNGEGIETSKNRKHQEGHVRKSKGLELIQQKINTLNRLYNIQMQLQYEDLGKSDPEKHGTRVTLVYTYTNLNSLESLPTQ